MAASSSGLDGLVVAETELSEVDGEQGRLVIRGFDVEVLAERSEFEDVCHLLWKGALPSAAEKAGLRARMGEARSAAYRLLPHLGDALTQADGMTALRAATGHLSASDPAAISIVGALPVFASAWLRATRGLPAIAPDPSLSLAADYLRMIGGELPQMALVQGMDAYLVTVSDHGMNASTFAARVVASTASDDVSAVVAGICALKGPLHGGAPGPVLDMLDAIGAAEQAEAWLEQALAQGERIMGFGHRIYRVRDPRAAVFEQAIERLQAQNVASPRLALARAVERAAEGALRARHPERPLHTNVEFYTAVLLDTVGLPRELFTPTFAVARAAGWCAHIAEQRRAGRLIRPESRYVGPPPLSRVAALA
jgi:citrate synthase